MGSGQQLQSKLFSVAARDGKARLGTLAVPSRQHPQDLMQRGSQGELQPSTLPVTSDSACLVHTPASLIYTRRGGTPNLIPDMLRRLEPTPQGYQINVLHLWVTNLVIP